MKRQTLYVLDARNNEWRNVVSIDMESGVIEQIEETDSETTITKRQIETPIQYVAIHREHPFGE